MKSPDINESQNVTEDSFKQKRKLFKKKDNIMYNLVTQNTFFFKCWR